MKLKPVYSSKEKINMSTVVVGQIYLTPQLLAIFCEKSCQEQFFKYLCEFLSYFDAYTLIFSGFVWTFLSYKNFWNSVLSVFPEKLLTSNGTKWQLFFWPEHFP